MIKQVDYTKFWYTEGAQFLFLLSLLALGVKNPPANAGDISDAGLIPGLGRSPGGGKGNPLQYSCLQNPTDRGAWQATVHRVTKSQTRLSRFHFLYIYIYIWFFFFITFLGNSNTKSSRRFFCLNKVRKENINDISLLTKSQKILEKH